MRSPVHIIAIRQLHEEIPREVAANRLARELRANGDTGFRSLRNVRWELARYAGLLGELLR